MLSQGLQVVELCGHYFVASTHLRGCKARVFLLKVPDVEVAPCENIPFLYDL